MLWLLTILCSDVVFFGFFTLNHSGPDSCQKRIDKYTKCNCKPADIPCCKPHKIRGPSPYGCAKQLKIQVHLQQFRYVHHKLFDYIRAHMATMHAIQRRGFFIYFYMSAGLFAVSFVCFSNISFIFPTDLYVGAICQRKIGYDTMPPYYFRDTSLACFPNTLESRLQKTTSRHSLYRFHHKSSL